jgi:hypothetical protein
MTTATKTSIKRIIPRGVYSEHAYAFGYLRGKVQTLIEAASRGYYNPEHQLLELESRIAELESILKQLESEMYPNDSE